MASLDLKIKPTAIVRHYRVTRGGGGGGVGGEVNSFNPSRLNYNSQSQSLFKDGKSNEVEN